jgi:hypothetical protein
MAWRDRKCLPQQCWPFRLCWQRNIQAVRKAWDRAILWSQHATHNLGDVRTDAFACMKAIGQLGPVGIVARPTFQNASRGPISASKCGCHTRHRIEERRRDHLGS